MPDKQYPIGWPELGKVLLWGSLLGFGGRGVVGMGRMVGRRLKEKEEQDEHDRKHSEQMAQMTATPGFATTQSYEPDVNKSASLAFRLLSSEICPKSVRKENSDGQEKQAEKQGLHPLLASILGVSAGAGGLYGGWSLADKLFDRERIKSIDEEIELAKKEYEDVLKAKTKLNLRVPKMAAFIDSMAESYERGELTKKAANISFMDALPYLLYTVLAGAAANEAHRAFKASRSANPIVAKLEAMRTRPPAKRVMPVRATLAEPLDEEEMKPVPSMAM